MKIISTCLIAISLIALSGCSRSDEDRAREQARAAAHQMELDARKASHELNKDLEKTRDKVHEAIDDHK